MVKPKVVSDLRQTTEAGDEASFTYQVCRHWKDHLAEFGNGDSFGLKIVGSTFTIYYKAGAGSWTSLGTRNDATWSAAGKVEC